MEKYDESKLRELGFVDRKTPWVSGLEKDIGGGLRIVAVSEGMYSDLLLMVHCNLVSSFKLESINKEEINKNINESVDSMKVALNEVEGI